MKEKSQKQKVAALWRNRAHHLADGGSNSYENVVCACRVCNQRNASKSNDDPEGAAIERLRWFLARKPQRTRTA